MFCLVKWAKTNAFSSIGKMKADNSAKSFPTYRIFVFPKFDRLEKIWQFYQPSSCLLKKKRLFLLILRGKTLFFCKKKNAQNQRAKLIFWKWVKLLLYNFGLFQQVFENLKLNKLVKEERRLDLEDRIWRLKFGKTQFWSCILKNEFESL